MDENRYQDWLALFAPQCLYWVPSNRETMDASQHVSIIYAERPALENHVRRLAEGRAFAQQPPSRMRRLVGNVEVEADGGDDAEWSVTSNFTITEIRNRSQRLHTGQCNYRLVSERETFLITYKKVNLVAIDQHHDNLTFLL